MKIITNEVSEYNLTVEDLDGEEGGVYESNYGDVYIVTDERQIVSLLDGGAWDLEGHPATEMRYREVDAVVSY